MMEPGLITFCPSNKGGRETIASEVGVMARMYQFFGPGGIDMHSTSWVMVESIFFGSPSSESTWRVDFDGILKQMPFDKPYCVTTFAS
jgi:hypothetical protein